VAAISHSHPHPRTDGAQSLAGNTASIRPRGWVTSLLLSQKRMRLRTRRRIELQKRAKQNRAQPLA